MLAESLEEMRQRVARRFEARIAEAPGSPGGSEYEPRDWLPAALDDLTASLRRGRVEPNHLPSGRPVEPQGCRLRSGQRPDLGAVAGDYGLLGECIFDLIEQEGLDVSLREMRILSRWLSARTAAAAMGHAEQLRDQMVENARVQQQLRESESRFRVALAHSNVSVFEKDSELRLRWMYNPMFGTQPADVIGKTDADFFSPEEAAKLVALQRSALRTGDRIRQEVSVSPRGERRHLLVDIEPLRDPSGAVIGLTGAATDITDQKRAQEDLAQALAFREQVLGILGHDLRNPLGAVRVLATLLLRREDLPEAVRSSLWEIDRSGERMLEMIGTLLDFTESRVKETLPVAPVPMDMHELCRSVVEELLAANPGRSIELEVEGDGGGRWDPARLAQVVANLIGNALKHGARHGSVSVSVSGHDEDVVLEVSNEGPVISPEVMRVLFEPFRRGSDSRDASHARGLGLGLYIVRLIVNAHGGAISVESTREQGTAFKVRLPRTAAVQMSEPLRAEWDGGVDAGA